MFQGSGLRVHLKNLMLGFRAWGLGLLGLPENNFNELSTPRMRMVFNGKSMI